MIISVSRRTDIPAFFSEWFMQRIKEGYVTYVNPYNQNKIHKISLKKEDVDVIVFWTKNPKPMIKYLKDLDSMGYKYYFQFTLNNYSKIIEPNLPSYLERIETFKNLSNMIGKERVILRYDPIILSDITDFNYHINNFSKLIRDLSNYTQRVVISFLDDYRGSISRFKKTGINLVNYSFDDKNFRDFVKIIADIAKQNNLEIYSCAEVVDLEKEGILNGKCIDDKYIKKVFNIDVSNRKDAGQRKECGCVMSRDIGEFDTCLHKCVYCYANRADSIIDKKVKNHNKNSPSLIGWHDVKEKPELEQISFWD